MFSNYEHNVWKDVYMKHINIAHDDDNVNKILSSTDQWSMIISLFPDKHEYINNDLDNHATILHYSQQKHHQVW